MTQGFVNHKCFATRCSIDTRQCLWGTFGDTQARRCRSRKAKRKEGETGEKSEPEEVTGRALAGQGLPPTKTMVGIKFAGSQLLSDRGKYPLQPCRAGQSVSTSVRPG